MIGSDDGYEPVRRDERPRRVAPAARAVGSGGGPVVPDVPAPPPPPTATPTPRVVDATATPPLRERRSAE